ncbi:hypothetical protein ACQR1I_36600 [Bradyrhizobium sp. HKCCYLS2038]|uniref:hypothetical protein n=1 Tax=unclassified Bradyrhizobium TaxID=2631580 RepID=UPI003EB998E7
MALDALIVTHDIAAREPAADFSNLPFRTSAGLYNPENAFLSENVVAPPFNDLNLWLTPGVHLSWSIPQALTRGVSNGSGGATFPQLPNRWLVARTGGGGSPAGWVVESDYVWPEGEDRYSSAITMPWTPDTELGETQPFRYVGRVVPLADWQEDMTAQRIASLVAPGYGVEDFLASYPNCFSLFGLNDDSITNLETDLNGATYQVLGWYSDLAVDPIAIWSGVTSLEQLPAGLDSTFGWTLTGIATAMPRALLVYGVLEFNTTNGIAPSVPDGSGLSLWMGNTGGEALAAYLSTLVDTPYASLIEEQIDAIQLRCVASAEGMEDTGFAAALHRQGFRSHSAGASWQLVANGGAAVSPPEALADALAAVNRLQQAYSDAVNEIGGWKERIFADWYKYMVSKFPPDFSQQDYPDPDKIEFFMREEDFAPIEGLAAATGDIDITVDPVSLNFVDAQADGAASSLAVALAAALKDLSVRIGDQGWTLRRREAAPYRAPAEPVLLFAGNPILPVSAASDAKEPDLFCLVEDLTVGPPQTGATAGALLAAMATRMNEKVTAAATWQWTRQPWIPIAMEWEVEILPLADDHADPVAAGGFSPKYLTNNFTIGTGPDLELDPAATIVSGNGAVYAGRCLLSGHGPAALQTALCVYLRASVLPPYFKAENIPPQQQAGFDLIANLAAVTAWFVQAYEIAKQSPAQQAENVEYSALRSLAALLGTPTLTQRIAGFNAALLMFRQTLQLPVTDPISLAAGAAFTAIAAGHIADGNRLAPVPLNIFLPIRAGGMKILRLRILDRFGQVLAIDGPDCGLAMTLLNPELPPGLAYLPPRLPQYSRLAVDWLDDDGNPIVAGNDHALSPICGWILPNYLDNSLMLYEANGDPLGALSPDPAQMWQPSPSAPQKTSTLSIRNRHLQSLVNAMLAYQRRYPGSEGDVDSSFFGSLMDVMEQNAPLNLPSSGAQLSTLPLMIGRPLAMVRLRLNWTVDGLLAIDQSWNGFREDLETRIRDSWGVADVQIPVAFGDPAMPANGLVGYWIGGGDDVWEETFYAPLYPDSEAAPPCPLIAVPTQGSPITLPMSLAHGPVVVTALIDPRAPVFLRSGLAPEESLQLSPALFSAAMRSLAVTFYSGPVVMPEDRLELTLPKIAGATWRWYATDDGRSRPEKLSPFRSNATFGDRRVVREGWLNLNLGDDLAPGPPAPTRFMDGTR